MRAPRLSVLLTAAAVALGTASCGEEPPTPPERARGAQPGEARFPTVRRVVPSRAGEGAYDFAVTISSGYDSPERYADGWRVRAPDGEVLGEHELAHDHADEQPFTREQTGVEVPPGVRRVTVEPHDSKNGYGGRAVEVPLP